MSDHFNEKAKTWDADELIKKLSSAVGSSILKSTPLSKDMLVMDFGAGTGLISSHVAPLVGGIVAVDISEAMLEKLAAKPELANKVTTACQDILEQPLDEKFDLIMSAMAMHHVKDTDELVQTFFDHLKPGAMIALADLDKEDGSFHPEGTEGVFHSGFDQDAFQAILEKHGFENVHFFTAHVVEKNEKRYPIFLVSARKAA
jgi:2-polyprenyl-3-methyl-5-hydroxy-6-metoxy-1,4-benzoquinol methylase